MNSDESLDDDSLLARLRDVAAMVDGPPDLAYELGRAAFAWRDADSELAQLVADSALESSMVRSATADTRLLSFESEDRTIEIQVSLRRGKRSLLGQLISDPATTGGLVRLETVEGPGPSAPLDAVGRFEIDDVPASLLRLRFEAPGTPAVTTAWVTL